MTVEKHRFVFTLAICLSALGRTGCESRMARVTGTVTLDGKPLEEGTVVFTAADRPSATGVLGRGGRFDMTTGASRGLIPGDYLVTVSAYRTSDAADGSGEPVPDLKTLARYNQPETSDLTARVQPGSSRLSFALTSSP